VISVLHRSQSMAELPVISLAEFMMDALLQPRGNPSGVSLIRAAVRARSQNSNCVTFCPGMWPVLRTAMMARSRRSPLRVIIGAPHVRSNWRQAASACRARRKLQERSAGLFRVSSPGLDC